MYDSGIETAAILHDILVGHAGPFVGAGYAVLKSVFLVGFSLAVDPGHVGPSAGTDGGHVDIGALDKERPQRSAAERLDLNFDRLGKIDRFTGKVGIHYRAFRAEFYGFDLNGGERRALRDIGQHTLAGHVDKCGANLAVDGEVAFDVLFGLDGPYPVLIHVEGCEHRL